MKIINEAYSVLSDPARKKIHDEWIENELAKINNMKDFEDASSFQKYARPESKEENSPRSSSGTSSKNFLLLGMLGAIGGFIVILIAAGIGKIGGKVASEAILGPPPSDIVAATAREINKKLPMMVGTETRLDSTTAGPGRILAYNYTLVNYSASQLDASSLAALQPLILLHSHKQRHVPIQSSRSRNDAKSSQS